MQGTFAATQVRKKAVEPVEYAYAAINSGVNGTKRLAVARVGEPHLAPPVFADTVIATVN